MVSVRTESLTKTFGKTVAVNNVSFTVEEGQLATFLGPSGCGKTTLLRMIAGLEKPDSGSVYFNEKEVTSLPPGKRNVGFVFQRMSMFPHMTVKDNVIWGLKLRKWPKEKIEQRVKEMLKLVHLEGLENRYFNQLSGGQAQRVVIARSLAPDPDILLLDEPLSMLDAKLRDELKREIYEIHKQTKKTTLFVTHDQAEAFSIADIVFLMNNGKIEQSGTPLEIYENPKSMFAAEFIGSNNFLKGKIINIEKGKSMTVETEGITIHVPYQTGYRVKDEVLVCIRADDIDIISEKERALYLNAIKVKIENSIFTGRALVLEAKLNEQIIKINITGSKRFKYVNKKGMEILCGFNPTTVIRA